MLHRLFLAAPVAGIFAATSLIFLAARAPQTWAAHWTPPSRVGLAAGQNEFGAARASSGAWDTLWINDDAHTVVFTAPASRSGRSTSLVIDHGDVLEPTLLRVGQYEVGAWVRNRNGATDLMGAILEPQRARRVFRLISSSQPIEHPYLFQGTRQSAHLVFSWQRFGNYDVFLLTMPLTRVASPLTAPIRLTHSQYYSFYPRAVASTDGHITILHLESCCQQQVWHVVLDRYDWFGRHAGTSRSLGAITGYGDGTSIPSQWAEDLRRDSTGAIWGAFAADGGLYVFKLAADGRLLGAPRLLVPMSPLSTSISLGVEENGGDLFWEQTYDLGTYVESQRFGGDLGPVGAAERVAYESAAESNPHAFMIAGKPQVIWQAIGQGLRSHFELSTFRHSSQPTLAQRLGLGLGNPWSELALLAVTSIGVAALTTVGNIILVFALALLGLVAMRLLRPLPGRWLIYTLLLSGVLYLTFVAPGGPILFLSTIPSMGLGAVPFGVIAALGALAFMGWMGLVAMRRLEDLYRAGLMAVLGVYFFAFVEAIVFLQQRIGYI